MPRGSPSSSIRGWVESSNPRTWPHSTQGIGFVLREPDRGARRQIGFVSRRLTSSDRPSTSPTGISPLEGTSDGRTHPRSPFVFASSGRSLGSSCSGLLLDLDARTPPKLSKTRQLTPRPAPGSFPSSSEPAPPEIGFVSPRDAPSGDSARVARRVSSHRDRPPELAWFRHKNAPPCAGRSMPWDGSPGRRVRRLDGSPPDSIATGSPSCAEISTVFDFGARRPGRPGQGRGNAEGPKKTPRAPALVMPQGCGMAGERPNIRS